MAREPIRDRGTVNGAFTRAGLAWSLVLVGAAAAWCYATTAHATMEDFTPAVAVAITAVILVWRLRGALYRLVVEPLTPLVRGSTGASGPMRPQPAAVHSDVADTEIGAVLDSWNMMVREAQDTRAREALGALITVMSRGFDPERNGANGVLLDQLLRCALLLVHGDAALLRLSEHAGSDPNGTARTRHFVCDPTAAGSPVIQVLDTLPSTPELRREPTLVTETGRLGAMGLAHLPIRIEARQVGVLTVARRTPFDERDRDALAALAGYLGLILEHLVLSQRVFTQATRDALTGTLTRRSAFDLLGRELARSDLETRPMSVLMVDLDGFKAVNDRYGHQTGDEILARAAAAITHSLRFGAHVGRYGGDEFLVVLSDAPHGQAIEVGQRIRDAISRTLGSPRGGDSPAGLHVTPSVGAATAPQHGLTPDALVARADAALYLAKQRGRNRIESADAVQAARLA